MPSHPNRTAFDRQAPTREFHQTDYRRWLHRQSEAGNWFMFQRLFRSVMSSDASVLVQSIINLGRGTADQDGWVLATTDYLKKTLFMGRKCVEKTLRELRLRGFITTRTAGVPRKRFVRVELDEINAAIDRAQNISTCIICDDTEPSESPHTCAIKDKGLNPSGDTTYPPRGAGGVSPPRTPPDSCDPVHVRNPPPSTFVPKGGSQPVNPHLGNCPPNPRDKAPKYPVEEVDRNRAKRLKDYVRNQGWSLSASPKNWEQAFAILRRRSVICATQIDRVLDYLTLHHPKDAAPRIRNARELIDRWDWLNDLADKAEKNKPVTVSPQADDIANRLANMGWPKGSEARLPEAVQKSLDAFRAFQAKLRPFVKGNVPGSKQARNLWDFAKHVWASSLDSAPWFIEDHFVKIHKRVRGWDGWSGSFDHWLFNVSKLAGEGRGWSTDYCGDPDLWNLLLKEIGCEG